MTGAGAALIARARAGDAEIVLDLSRLVSRCLHDRPTGVDRVEMAYARRLLALLPEQLAFAAVHPSGLYGRLPRKAVLAFLDETEARWARDARVSRGRRRLRALRDLVRLIPRLVPRATVPRYLIQASPNHLHRPATVAAKLRHEGARYLCLVHDLIPIEYPEYARPGGAAQHVARMTTLADHADMLIANSAATARAMERFMAGRPRTPPVVPILLGTDAPGAGKAEPAPLAKPYFLILGTIEPRKNHILLLDIWRRMLELHGPDEVPLLIVAGRRGWENEHVIDMLERSSAISRHVIELGHGTDEELAAYIAHARALLLPSFAEGFGMPVAEALIMGTPVICSDLPALREVGGDVPDYIDPLDGAGWMAAIRDYAVEGSAARAAQIERMKALSLPSWEEHVAAVIEAAGTI